MTLALVIPAFYQVEPLAGLLMLPYLAWATFALYLNSTLIKMNPQVCTESVLTLPDHVMIDHDDSIVSGGRRGRLYGVQICASLAARDHAVKKGMPGRAMMSCRSSHQRSLRQAGRQASRWSEDLGRGQAGIR